jgi:hypothetical protein
VCSRKCKEWAEGAREKSGVGSESKVVSERGGSKRKIGERNQKGMLEFCREAEMC